MPPASIPLTRVVGLGLLLVLAGCGKGRSPGPALESNTISETARIDVETLHQYHLNLDRARQLDRHDRLAWIASDSIQRFVATAGPGHMRMYLVGFQEDSATVSWGDPGEGDGFLKYCEVGFSERGTHSWCFPTPRSGTESEVRQIRAIVAAKKDITREELGQGAHNFYALQDGDTLSVYAIPGYRPGFYIYGGSYLWKHAGGRLVSKRSFHLGYQTVKELRKMGEVEITSDLADVPNECDLMKFLAYQNIIPRMRIRTAKYMFFLWGKADHQVGFDMRLLPKGGR